jgi:bacterioferritin-associated ferredoxin
MFLCLCKAVSDRKVRQVVSEGAGSVKDVAHACDAGTGKGCGACLVSIRSLLHETEEACQNNESPTPSAG